MTQPNILWICTDQQRADALGCYGRETVDTSNIDSLAASGVQFDRCYSQSPVCTPSRASFLTGRYPRTTRCRQNGQAIPSEERTISKEFAERGYSCGLAGKLHLSPCNPADRDTESRIDDGYSTFHWSHDSQHPVRDNEYQQWLAEKNLSFDLEESDISEYVQTYAPPEHHQTTWCADRAIDYIEDHSGVADPWLFSLNCFDPHHPFDPPESYLEPYLDRLDGIGLPNYDPGELEDKPVYQRFDHHGAYNDSEQFPCSEMSNRDHRAIRAAYWAMVDLIDDQVGRLLDTLERTGQREDTIVIFSSDHGEMLGDHGIYLKGPYFYEPAVRVPLIVSQPGTIEEGVVSDALVELVDLAPTLLDAYGERQTPRMQGNSLYGLLQGDSDPDHHRETVYSEYCNAMPHHTEPVAPYGTMVRTDQYKLIRMHRLDAGELYDLEADPNETTNRWNDPEYAGVKTDLLETLADRMAETVDPVPQRQTAY